MPGGIEIRPRVETGIARLHRHGVEDPVALAGFGIVRLEESRRIEVVACAHQHVVVDDDRRHRREVLLIEVGDLDVPAFLACASIERDEVIVRRFEEQVVPPDGGAAVADVRPALGLPVVAPQLASVARVEGPDVVGRCDVEDTVDLQDRALHLGGGSGGELSGALTADDDGSRGRAAEAATSAKSATAAGGRRGIAGGQAGGPGEREVLDGRLVDLFERAVASAGVVARVGWPGISERLANRRRVETALCLAREKRGGQHHRGGSGNRTREDRFFDRHFSVTR